MKFSLLTLLGAVAIAAVGCAALTNPLPACVMAVFMGTMLLLLGAVLVAVYRRGATRAFWLGFAICGWGYLLFVFIGPRSELYPNAEGRLLPTTWALDELAEASIDQEQSQPTVTYQVYRDLSRRVVSRQDRYEGSTTRQASSAAGTGTPNNVAWRYLLQIGHSLWALLFASAGGVLARGLQKSQ